MDEADWLVERFEEQRARLRAVAFRMLGSQAEADDAVQNSWLRLSGADDVTRFGEERLELLGRCHEPPNLIDQFFERYRHLEGVRQDYPMLQ